MSNNYDAVATFHDIVAYYQFAYSQFQTTGLAPPVTERGTGGTLIELADRRMQALEGRLDAIDRRLSVVESRLTERPEVVIVEEISREEAKRRIVSFFETHDEADTEELMRNIRIDLSLLVELLDELKREGKIASLDTS